MRVESWFSAPLPQGVARPATGSHVCGAMRLLPLCIIALLATPLRAEGPPEAADTVTAVQKRPLRQAKRLEILPYGAMSIGDPYLQRWGAGLRAMYHLREGLSLGLDATGLGTWATEDFVIATGEQGPHRPIHSPLPLLDQPRIVSVREQSLSLGSAELRLIHDRGDQ